MTNSMKSKGCANPTAYCLLCSISHMLVLTIQNIGPTRDFEGTKKAKIEVKMRSKLLKIFLKIMNINE